MSDWTSVQEIKTEWLRFETLKAGELYELLRFRQDIFVVEQRSPYPDLDGLDETAWHLVARAEEKIAGYLRLIPVTGSAPLVRIGRVAVSPFLRRRGLGRMLMETALGFCCARYPQQPIALGAQLHLATFYKLFGFKPVSEPYDDFGVPHIEMRLDCRDQPIGGAVTEPHAKPSSASRDRSVDRQDAVSIGLDGARSSQA